MILTLESRLCEAYGWSIQSIDRLDLCTLVFLLQKIRENEDLQARKELAQMKLLLLAIHGDPEKLLESIEDMEYQWDESYDEEIGDLQRIRHFGRRQST